MKVIVLLAVIGMAAAAKIEYYTTLNDNLDIDAVVADPEEFQSYIDCFKGVKPCTDLANSYKVIIPESVEQGCRRCNKAQKHLARKFLEALKEKRPEEYEIFKKAFDPENKHFDDFIKSIAGY